MLDNNVLVGKDAGKNLVDGSYNIFIGNGAGEELKSSNNLFILKNGDVEYRFEITKENEDKFRHFINGVIEELY